MKKNLAILLSFLIIIFLFVVLVISRRQVEQPQQVKTRAAGNGKIAVYFVPDKTTLNPGETAAVGVWFRNTTASETLQLNVGETDINFDQNVFTASFTGNNPCNQDFLYNAQKKTISAGDVYIVCSLGGGDPLVSLAPGGTIKLADFNVTASAAAGAGATPLSFGKTNIPNAGDPINLTDLSDAGTITNLTIAGTNPTATPTTPGQPTNTPTPTRTPTPTPSTGQLTSTPTPTTPAVTSTPSPTPTSPPNTFNQEIDIKLSGVAITADAALNQYRSQVTGISLCRLYEKGNLSNWFDCKLHSGGVSYNSQTGKFRLSIINIPDSLKTNGILLIKPNRHLGAKICSNNQTVRCTPIQEIGSGAGLNFSSGGPVDLSSYPLLPGDVDQNGVLNGTDLVLMLQQLARDPASRSTQEDLNYDGVVTGADYQLMQDSMVVFDDE